MTNTTINKIILSATTAMFLTACGGGGGSSTPTADTEAPVITVPATQTVAFGGTYTAAVATVTDNIDTGLTATTSGSVDTHTAGTYTVTYSATDAAGNTGTATTVVTVSPAVVVADTEAPTITVPATQTVPFGGTYTPAVATVTDNVDTGLTATIGGDTVDVNTAGTYNVTYTATDAANNVGTATTVVTVTPQFTIGADTITDALTGLVWDKNASDAGTCSTPKTEPTIAQFQTIMDYTTFNPTVVTGFNLASDSTEYKTSDGWNIKLHDGQIINTTTATKTICVDARNEVQVTKQNLTRDNDTNKVTDPNTGLVWTDDTPLPVKTFSEATDICTANDGMRLPTITELNNLYDRDNKKIVDGFANVNNVGNGHYWTSTIAAGNANQAWTVGFSSDSNASWSGEVAAFDINTTTNIVRCVKDAE